MFWELPKNPVKRNTDFEFPTPSDLNRTKLLNCTSFVNCFNRFSFSSKASTPKFSRSARTSVLDAAGEGGGVLGVAWGVGCWCVRPTLRCVRTGVQEVCTRRGRFWKILGYLNCLLVIYLAALRSGAFTGSILCCTFLWL